MTFRSDATEGVWSLTQNVAVQTEANVVAIFFFHQCGFYDPTHHIRGCQKIIWNFALKGRALALVLFHVYMSVVTDGLTDTQTSMTGHRPTWDHRRSTQNAQNRLPTDNMNLHYACLNMLLLTETNMSLLNPGPVNCSSSIKWLSLLVTKCTVFDDVISRRHDVIYDCHVTPRDHVG